MLLGRKRGIPPLYFSYEINLIRRSHSYDIRQIASNTLCLDQGEVKSSLSLMLKFLKFPFR